MSRLTDARRAAIELLARREHSTAELSRKLSKKGFEKNEISSLLNHLMEEGAQSDTRFVEVYVHSRKQKGVGPLLISAELNARGISEDLIEEALDMTDNAWFDCVHLVWQKRFKGVVPKDYKARAQQMRFLQSRGFTLEHINPIFKKVF